MLARFALVACAYAAATVSAQQSNGTSATPTAEQLALVDAQYANSGFAQAPERGFGIELKSRGLLTVEYESFGVVENGQAYTADQVSDKPSVSFAPAEADASDFTNSTLFTLVLADANSLGDPTPNYRHYLENSAKREQDGEIDDGNEVTSYAGPGPLAGSGPHRYAWLLFLQPARFEPPQNLSGTDIDIGPWNVQEYVQNTGLELVAASFFTVQNGEPTGSVVETSAVNTATLSVSSAAASSSASRMTSSRVSSQTSAPASSASNSQSAPAPAATSPTSGAGKTAMSLGAVVVAAAALLA
ncbi:hypothetical protein OIV83_003596 [Microbotryomycetes sp. JL201]|nr:hypothetical protein OIV83_003596 [Microbotryomycetes sp. JL201]